MADPTPDGPAWLSYLLDEIRALRRLIEDREADEDLLLTLDEAAERLGVSRRKLDTLRSVTSGRKGRPRLRTVREGRSVRVARKDLAAYVTLLRTEAGIPDRT